MCLPDRNGEVRETGRYERSTSMDYLSPPLFLRIIVPNSPDFVVEPNLIASIPSADEGPE